MDFLSIGQGDCSVVRTGNGNTYLIDCGSSSIKSVGEYRLKPWLKYHGIAKLEAVFLSHPDSDHTNGVLEVLEKTNSPDDWYRGEIQIANLVLPAAYREETEAYAIERESDDGEAEQNEEKGFDAIYRLARKNGIPVLWFDTGDKVTEEGISFFCLHPSEEYPTYDTNDASMVLMIESQNTVTLFTGDIGRAGEACVMRELNSMAEQQEVLRDGEGRQEGENSETEGRFDEKTVILKVAHHGSKNSTSMEFLELVRPEVSVISCGRDNRFGHPHEETLQRLQQIGSRVVTTMDKGTVTMHIIQNK